MSCSADHETIIMSSDAGGGYSEKKGKWIECSKDYLLPIKALQKKFSYVFLTALRKRYQKEELYTENTKWNNPVFFKKMIDTLFQKSWVVYIKESFNNPLSVIKYLSKYTHRIAMSNHRINKVENDHVYFTYKDYKDQNKKKVLCLPLEVFMKRFLYHVVPKGFVRIRYYGLYAHRNKKKAIEECSEAFGFFTEEVDDVTGLSWQELFKKITGNDVTVCPYCKKGKF